MKWKINYLEDLGIVQAKTSGRMSWDDKKKLSEEMLAVGRKKNINAFLMDQKETAFGLSVMEIDRLPAVLRDTGFSPEDRMAVLVNTNSIKTSLCEFLRNFLSLNALQLQVFTDSEKASSWLTAKT